MYFVPQRINNSSDKEKKCGCVPRTIYIFLADKSQLSEQQIPRSSCVSDRKSEAESLSESTLEHLMVELYKIEKLNRLNVFLKNKLASLGATLVRNYDWLTHKGKV